MQVPKKIREAIIKCARYNHKANFYEQIIVEWLTKNKLTEETASDVMRNMDDGFIDYCQITCNPEIFIRELEKL